MQLKGPYKDINSGEEEEGEEEGGQEELVS